MVKNPDQDFVLKTIETRDVHFVRFWFTDVMGSMKSFAVIPSELDTAFEEGMGFDGSCVDGFAHTAESDMLAYPEASTFQILPWRPEDNAVARMFCSVRCPDKTPFHDDPRQILKSAIRAAADAGYAANFGPEVEFFYFNDKDSPTVLDHGGYFDLTSLDSASDLRRDTVLTLENMGIPVEYSHHESGHSQHEIDLRYSDALSMADAVMTYKLVVKEIAMKHGVYASFMPKPLADQPGSGMHVHQSLTDLDGNNLFFDENDPLGYNLSATAKSYIAGLLKYSREFSLLTNQFVNSYKRLRAGDEAPFYISWGRSNRSTLVRVPGYKPDKENACRVELRSPDPACNPYLAFAAMLTAGIAGIREGLELRDPIEDHDLATHTRQQINEAGIETLPENLGEAVRAFADSELMRELLGDRLHAYLIEAKQREWDEYQSNVDAWELDRYLEVL